MLQKITELWPGLVKVIGAQENDAEHPSDASKESDSHESDGHLIDAHQITQDY